jgi:hypothetical protein
VGTYATFPISIEVSVKSAASGGRSQSYGWYLEALGPDPGPPTSLSLSLELRKVDWKGTLRVDHEAGSSVLPAAYGHIYPLGRGWAGVSIRDSSILGPLWSSGRWRVTVLDRRGTEQAAADGALPSRQSIEEAVRTLGPELAGKAAAPEGQCREIGPDADI